LFYIHILLNNVMLHIRIMLMD